MKLKVKEFYKESEYEEEYEEYQAQKSIEQSLSDYFDEAGGRSFDTVINMINSTKVSQKYKDYMLSMARGYLEEIGAIV